MTGYTRQSVSDIQNGQEITASPINAEFNRVELAFNTSSGHSHDGTADNGPKIDLTTSITGYLPDNHGGVGGKNNTLGQAAPGNNDDASQGYSSGSLWMDISGADTQIYIFLDNTTGAAQWGLLGLWDPATLELDVPSSGYQIGNSANRPSIFAGTVNADVLTIGDGTSTASHTITGATNASLTIGVGTLTVSLGTTTTFFGPVNFNGNVTLGNTSADDIVFNGKVTTDILPVAGTENLGHPSSTTWANLYLNTGATIPTLTSDTVNVGSAPTYSGQMNVRGDLSVLAGFTPNPPPSGSYLGGNLTARNITAQNDLSISGNTTLGNTLSSDIITLNAKVSSNIIPSVNGFPGTTGYELGAPTNYWKTLYVHDVGVSGDLSAAGTITGTLNANSTTIQSVLDPVNAQDAATKAYVDNADAAKLNLSGGTMTGDISMDSSYQIRNLLAPVNASDAATKLYVDDAVSNLVGGAPAALDTLNELAAAIADDANYATTVTNLVATRLPLAGGVMSGNIQMSGGSTITSVPTPTAAGDATPKTYVDSVASLYLPLAGGTVTGNISLVNTTIDGLPTTPTGSTEATSKAYVDSILGSYTDVATIYDQFDDRYLGSKATSPSLDNDGDALLVGALYWDTTDNALNVYGGTGVGWTSLTQSAFGRQSHSASSGQTTFNAPAYTVGMVEVYLNGLRLKNTTDYTATSGSTVVLTSPATVNDEIEIIAYNSFEVANTYTQAQADARFLQVGAVSTALNNFIVGDGTNLSNKNATDVRNILDIPADGDATFGKLLIDGGEYNNYYIGASESNNNHFSGIYGAWKIPHTLIEDDVGNNNLSIHHPDNSYTGIKISPSGAYDDWSLNNQGGEIALVAHDSGIGRTNSTTSWVSGIFLDAYTAAISNQQTVIYHKPNNSDITEPEEIIKFDEKGTTHQLPTYTIEKTVNANNGVAGQYDFDISKNSIFDITLTEDTTINLTNDVSLNNKSRVLVFTIIQDSTDRSVTWPSTGITWKDGSAPTPSSGAGKKDIIVLLQVGSIFYGFVAAQGL